MSILEIEQQLKSLNQQLVDLESSIDDAIERNESKQELNKQIKRLEKKLQSLEKLELEQQELQAIQSEAFVNNDSSADQSAILESQSEQNIFYSTPVAIDLKKSTIIKQAENQNSQPIEKPVVYSASTRNHNTSNDLKDWQKSVLTGAVIGLFYLVGLALIKANDSFQSSNSLPTENQTNSTSAPTNTSSPEVSQQDNSSNIEETIKSVPEVNDQPQEYYSNNSNADESESLTNNYNFPLDSCGDKNPSGANNWYPVYVDDTPENLSMARSNYCRDAIRKYRKKAQINSIQVASFTDALKAEEFAELMRRNIGSGEVGEPTVYDFSGDSHTSSSHNYSINSEVTYHTNLIPIGNYSFYERGLSKMVSYQRTGNRMVGGVYDSQNPGVITCFAATIYSNQVAVDWWNNLWQIGKSGNSFSYTYSVAAFTADNGTPQPYLDNSNAVTQCN